VVFELEHIVPLPIQTGSHFLKSIPRDTSKPHVWARPGSSIDGSLPPMSYDQHHGEFVSSDKVMGDKSGQQSSVLMGGFDKGKGKRVADVALGSSLDGSKLSKVIVAGLVGVRITDLENMDDEGVGSCLGSSNVGYGSYGSSRPELVAVGPIAAHAEDALVLVPSTACSGAYNFQLVDQPLDSDKPKQACTPHLSPFNSLNSSEVVSFVEDLGVTFNSLDNRKCYIIEDV
jgi:hypothetical protein